jgi:hypothetical protein
VLPLRDSVAVAADMGRYLSAGPYPEKRLQSGPAFASNVQPTGAG